MASNELAARIRAKYPGEYDDMSDDELTKRVVAKYPEYADLAEKPVQSNSTVTMFDPDGVAREIPSHLVKQAQDAGAELATKIVAPDGNTHWIPNSRVQDAINAGGVRAGEAAVKRPNVNMPEPSGWQKFTGGLGSSEMYDEGRAEYDRRKKAGTLNEGHINAYEGSLYTGDTDQAAAMTGAGVVTGTALAGAAAAPAAGPAAVKAWLSVPTWAKYAIASEILRAVGAGHLTGKLKGVIGE